MHTVLSSLDHPLLEESLLAVAAAGEQLRRYYKSHNQITAKAVANFVSEADVASEEILREMLLQADPSARFLGEESAEQMAEWSDDEACWIVDPLDGTTNFLHGLPHFAISAAYRCGGQTEMGIVHNPISGEWFCAVRGQGAFLGEMRLQVSEVTAVADGMYCFGFFYDRDRAMAATLRCVETLMRRQVHGIRRFGAAALDLAAVASGRFEGFFEFELQPWDIAAGKLLVEEAGGSVSDCLGRPPATARKSSVLATNAAVHQELLELIEPYFLSAL